MTEPTSGERARAALAGTRFADVRWTREIGSTNAAVLDLARAGEPEGIVVVADHQTAGRGRLGRTWTAPPESGLLMTILLRPPALLSGATMMATAVAAATAVGVVAGREPRLKWPNDLVFPGDGSAPDRKLAGILAEVDWPAGSSAADGYRPPGPGERAAVAVGIGINVRWPADRPEELADIAVTAEEIAGHAIDRVDLLVTFLRDLDARYSTLLADGGRSETHHAWRSRSATLGRRVRVDLGANDVEGLAVDVTDDGHLVVDDDGGRRHTFAVGDVVHVRPTTAG